MIKKLIILLLPVAVLAQNDPKAESILKKVSETNKAYKDIQVKFNYELNNKQAGVTDQREGELILSGTNFHLQLMGQHIYSDGKIVWVVLEEDMEVHVKSIDEFKSETDLDPANIFNQYDKGFKSKFYKDEAVDGKSLSSIDLFPEDPSAKPYSRVRLGIDKATNHIVYSTTFGKDGTDYKLTVVEMKTDTGVAADMFVYNQGKFQDLDYDIVDFR